MKKNIVLAATLVSFFLSAAAHAEEIKVSVKGMVCSFCAQGIKKTFGRKDSVESVNVDLEKKVVDIKTKKGAALPDTEIRDAIVDSGFEVIHIERIPDA